MNSTIINNIILKATYTALSSNSRMASMFNILGAGSAFYFLSALQSNHPVKSISLLTIFLVNASCLLLSLNKKIPEKNWMRTFTFMTFLTSLAWSTFFVNLALTSHSFPITVPFVFLGPLVLCSISFLTMACSRKNSLLYQTPLLISLLASFLIVYEGTSISFVGAVLITMFWLYSTRAQANLNATWMDLQIYNYELQHIIDFIPGGLCVVKDGRYIKVNSYIKEVLQIENDKILQRSVNLVNPDSKFTESLNKFLDSKIKRTQGEYSFTTVLGERTHYVIFRRLYLEDDSDQIIISFFDIEELKQAQADLEKHRSKMEYNSKMASLGEMSSGLAHEINNPLAVISARTQLLQLEMETEQFDKGKIAKSVDTILSMTQRISKIIKSLKLFARDSSLDSIQSAVLNDIVDETVSLCEIYSVKFSAQITKIGFEENYVVECLPTQISQVLLNALNNSFDAIDSLKEKWIKIELINLGKQVRIEVTDSGAGIPKLIQEKVMMPFFTTKNAGRGTGLGLSLSKGIIDSHGGQIYFDHQSPNTKLVIILPKLQTTKSKPLFKDVA